MHLQKRYALVSGINREESMFTQANSVAVSGSFNKWNTPIPLQRVGRNDFKVELDLTPEPYEYKYIVDGMWKHDPLAPVVASGLGSLNNVRVHRRIIYF